MTNPHKTPMDVQKVTLVDAYGNILTAAGVVSQEDGSEFVVGASYATPMMGLYEATPSTVDDGDVGVVGMTDDRALRVHVDNAGDIGGGGGGGGGDATLAEQQTQTAHLSEIEGAVEALETAVATIDTTPLLRVAVFDNNDTQITSFGGGGGGGGTQWDDGDDIDTNSQGNLILGATGISGTARVIRVDDDGAVHVADGGNSLTVDGTVGVSGTVTVDGSGVTQPISAASLPLPTGAATAANQSTANGHLSNIVTAVQLLDNAISGSEMQVDVVGALPAGTNLLGIVSGGINDTYYQGTTSRTVGRAIIDAASSGNNTLLAAQGSGNKIRVHSLFLVSAGEVNVRFESGADGTALTGQMNLVANTGFVLPFNPLGWFETAANTLLNLELSAAVSVDGAFQYSVVQ